MEKNIHENATRNQYNSQLTNSCHESDVTWIYFGNSSEKKKK